MARRFRPIAFGDLVAVISLFALLSLQLGTFADDPGVWWHFRSGQITAHTGNPPKVDPLIYSTTPRPWIADQWLSDLVLYKLFHLGSWPLLYLVLTLIYMGTYFAIILPRAARLSGAAVSSVIAVFLAFKIGLVHFILRPVVFTFPLFALLMHFLFGQYREIKESPAVPLSRKFLLLPLLFILWANLHPSFLLGIAFLWLLPVALLLDGVFLYKPILNNRKLFVNLAGVGLLCALVTLINPYGVKLHQAVLSLLSSDFFSNLYQEWHSPNFKELPGSISIAMLAVIAVSALASRSLKWGFYEVLAIIAISDLTFKAARNFPFFGIVLCLPFAEALHALFTVEKLKQLPVFRILVRPMKMLEARESNSLPPLLFLTSLTLLVGFYFSSGRVLMFKGPYGPSDTFPHQALENIPSGSVVASTLAWGGFVESRSDLKSIIDDRSTVLGEAYYLEYFKRFSPTADWKQYLKERGATHLLLPPGAPIALAAQSEGFALQYHDALSSLFQIP